MCDFFSSSALGITVIRYHGCDYNTENLFSEHMNITELKERRQLVVKAVDKMTIDSSEMAALTQRRKIALMNEVHVIHST